MKFYTNVTRKGNLLYVRGWDQDGKRVNKVVKYKPQLYISSPSPTSKYTNLNGKTVKPMSFKTMYAAKEFIDQYADVAEFAVYGFDRYEYCYIAEKFPKLEYDISRINSGNIDIETYSINGFPESEQAKSECEITVITIRKNGKSYVLSTKPYETDDKNIIFFLAEDEKDMLRKFVALWSKLDLDIITGWNINNFDIPVLILRIAYLLGWDTAKGLSPWNKVDRRERYVDGKLYIDYEIAGISALDYMVVYKKFCLFERDSYSLNNIAYIELEEKKLDYSEHKDLNTLWHKDPQKYIEYNIHDTRLVDNLEKKLKYIERSIVVAYDAKVNYEDALTSVLLWECIIMNDLRSRNIVMPITKNQKREPLLGAFVKVPQVGFFDWVVSFDLTSLYPHIMIGWNISPETLRGKDARINIDNVVDGNFDKESLLERNLGLAANGCLYDNTIRGFLAEVIEKQFKQRATYKKKMLKLQEQYEETKDESLKDEITKYDNYQYGKKIQLNSAYGAVANPYFKFYNIDNAGAVTHTGQAIIQYIANRLNGFLNSEFQTQGIDYIIASDTDSVYINLGPFVVSKGLTERTQIIDALDKFAEKNIAQEIEKVFEEFTKNLNAFKNALHMKRESIIEKALWRAKKNYAVWIWDQEGVRYKEVKLKVVGMEVVRSNIPEICRKKIKEGIALMYTGGESAVQEMIANFRKEYMALSIYDIARPTSVKDYVKHIPKTNVTNALYGSGAPKHVKASIIYNKFIEEHNLTSKYRRIYNGDKIKYLHLVKFNPFRDSVIGAPDGNFPPELDIEQWVDKHNMFEKTFLNPMTSIMGAAGWTIEKHNSLEAFFT